MTSRIIVFAPHPDDETFGCGGTIARRISEGCEVEIVVLTDGRNALLNLFGIESEPKPSELKEIRKEESRRAARILGVTEDSMFFLDFEDGALDRNSSQAKEKVSEILEKNIPSEVYVTYEKDVNMDHRVTNCLVKDSIKKSSLDAACYQYSIFQKHGFIGPKMDTFFSIFRNDMIRVDISKFLPLKKKALKEFKSQIEIISPLQERPVVEETEKFLKNQESFFITR